MLFSDFLRGRRRSRLTSADLTALEEAVGEVKRLPARYTLIHRDEPVKQSTYLVEGFICRYMDDKQGLRQLVAVHVAGDFVDLHGYPLERLDHDLATLTACKVVHVPHGRLDAIVAARPALAKLLWFSTLLDAAMHREWIFRLGRLDAVSRVGHFLCEIEAKLRAVGRSDGMRFALPMTQADLGEACGITAVHINRMLRELREKDIVSVQSNEVTILDKARLYRLSEFDPNYLFLDDMGGNS